MIDIAEQVCDTNPIILDENLMTLPAGVGISRNHYLTSILEKAVKTAIPAGIPQYLYKKFKYDIITLDDRAVKVMKEPYILSLDHLNFGFVIWLIACGVCMCAFFGEVTFFYASNFIKRKIHPQSIQNQTEVQPVVEENLDELITEIEPENVLKTILEVDDESKDVDEEEKRLQNCEESLEKKELIVKVEIHQQKLEPIEDEMMVEDIEEISSMPEEETMKIQPKSNESDEIIQIEDLEEEIRPRNENLAIKIEEVIEIEDQNDEEKETSFKQEEII